MKVSIVDNVMLKRIRFFASGDLASIVAKTMAIAGLRQHRLHLVPCLMPGSCTTRGKIMEKGTFSRQEGLQDSKAT